MDIKLINILTIHQNTQNAAFQKQGNSSLNLLQMRVILKVSARVKLGLFGMP